MKRRLTRVEVGALKVEASVVEGRAAEHAHALVRLGKMPPSKDPEESRLSSSIGSDQQAARSVGELHIEVTKHWFAAGVAERKAIHVNVKGLGLRHCT